MRPETPPEIQGIRGTFPIVRAAGPGQLVRSIGQSGAECWHVVESLIFDGSRGRGLAAPMHQAAYVQLESAPGDVIWGTIDPRNGASLATALAVGRVDIGGDWWIDGKHVT